MRRKLWLLGAFVLLLAIACPVSADHGPMRFQAPGGIFLTLPGQCSETPGDYNIGGTGKLLTAGNEFGTYVIDCEVVKVKYADTEYVVSKVIEGKMTITTPDGWFVVSYQGPSVQRLLEPCNSPYGPAWITWVGHGKVTDASEAFQYMLKANFTWKGFVVGETPPDPAKPPIPIVGWMRFNPRARR